MRRGPSYRDVLTRVFELAARREDFPGDDNADLNELSKLVGPILADHPAYPGVPLIKALLRGAYALGKRDGRIEAYEE